MNKMNLQSHPIYKGSDVKDFMINQCWDCT